MEFWNFYMCKPYIDENLDAWILVHNLCKDIWKTGERTDGQTYATTIPLCQNWPGVIKTQMAFHNYQSGLLFMCIDANVFIIDSWHNCNHYFRQLRRSAWVSFLNYLFTVTTQPEPGRIKEGWGTSVELTGFIHGNENPLKIGVFPCDPNSTQFCSLWAGVLTSTAWFWMPVWHQPGSPEASNFAPKLFAESLFRKMCKNCHSRYKHSLIHQAIILTHIHTIHTYNQIK